MTNPYAPPDSQPDHSIKLEKEIEKVRTGQKLLIYAILLNVGVTISSMYLPMLGLLQFGVLGVSIYGLVRLFQGLKMAMWVRGIIFLTMILPLINLLVLLRLNSRATKTLREAGYKVGLMGASSRLS